MTYAVFLFLAIRFSKGSGSELKRRFRVSRNRCGFLRLLNRNSNLETGSSRNQSLTSNPLARAMVPSLRRQQYLVNSG